MASLQIDATRFYSRINPTFREDGEFQETGAEEEERKKITYDFASQEIS